MDEAGNILVRRYCKSNIFVKSTSNNVSEETAIGAEIIKLPGMALETEKIVKVFPLLDCPLEVIIYFTFFSLLKLSCST